MSSGSAGADVSFEWEGKQIPVTHPLVDRTIARMAVNSAPFQDWVERCSVAHGTRKIDLLGVEIQNVDLFGKG